MQTEKTRRSVGYGLDTWTARRSNQLNEVNSEYSLEQLMLKLKFQYLGHLR